MKNQKPIRALIADSSPADIDALIAILSTDPEIEVIGVATTGKQVIALVPKLRPDIVAISDTLGDVAGARGTVPILEVVKQIMAYSPTPILMLSDPNCNDGKSNVLKALSMGALDVIQKPTLDQWLTPGYAGASSQRSSLVEAVRLLSRVKVITHLAGKFQNPTNDQSLPSDLRVRGGAKGSSFVIRRSSSSPTRYRSLKVVAIAASTGGPSALARVLGNLPVQLRICVVIVQHVAEGFSAGLAEWLDRESEITVREARDGDRMRAGYAFLAPTGSHMAVESRNRIVLNGTPPVAGHRPSADVLLASVAKTYGRNSIGVILTGMGSDGAEGIVAIKNAGGKAIAQDEQTCVVFGMPKAAVQTGVVDKVLPLDSIAEGICGFAGMAHTLSGDD